MTRVPEVAVPTFGDAWREWLRHIEFDKQRKASTVNDHRSQSRRYLLDYFGEDTPLTEITTERIEQWQQELIEEGRLARRTMQKSQGMLHALLKRARKKRWVERNAAEDADSCARIGLWMCAWAARWPVDAAKTATEAAIYRTAAGAGLRMVRFAGCAGATSTSAAG